MTVFSPAKMPAALFVSLALATGIAAPVSAQDEGGAVEDSGEIVVLATRIRGSVETDLPPVATFDEADIAALGAGSLQELLGVIGPQTGSGRGRGGGGEPVVLLNGLKVSGFRELRGLPPEAIRKVEVLPEEVALKYGFRPNQRVVNFIMKDDFRSLTLDAEARVPDKGGFSEQELQASFANITGGSRLNITGQLTNNSPLTEAERGTIQPSVTGALVSGDPDPAAYRTLIDDAQSASLNMTWAKAMGTGASLSLNGMVEQQKSQGLFGLDAATLTGTDGTQTYRTTLQGGPLTRNRDTLTLQTGAAYNRPLGGWALSATADYRHVRTETDTDRRADFNPAQTLVMAGQLLPDSPLPMLALPLADKAKSNTDNATGLVTVSGQPFRLPAGEASLTVKGGFAYSAIKSTDTRNPGIATDLSRKDTSAGFSIDIPLTSRREGFGGGLGDVSLNLNGDINHLSDFGTLKGYGAGLSWSPAEKLTLQASYIASEAAPGLTDLGAPTVVTPGVSLYDFVRGETVLASVITGGNRALKKERQRDWKFGVNWVLPFLQNSNLVAEYFRNRSYDTTNAFPLLTPAIEAAFPGRVQRDADGRLVALNQTPVTFAQEQGERLRYGINLGGSFGKPDPNARRSPMVGVARGAGGAGSAGSAARGGSPRGFGGPGGGDGRGRWNLALYHTVRFAETVQIAPGGPQLDMLNGDALTGGGVARHSIELEGGAFYRGFGARVEGTYTGGTHINGSSLTGSNRIDFAPIATFNLRLFADLGRMEAVTKAVPFLKGSRLSFRVENLFDAQQRVRDVTGAVPLRYQPGYLDPRGRVFEVDFRKQF